MHRKHLIWIAFFKNIIFVLMISFPRFLDLILQNFLKSKKCMFHEGALFWNFGAEFFVVRFIVVYVGATLQDRNASGHHHLGAYTIWWTGTCNLSCSSAYYLSTIFLFYTQFNLLFSSAISHCSFVFFFQFSIDKINLFSNFARFFWKKSSFRMIWLHNILSNRC